MAALTNDKGERLVRDAARAVAAITRPHDEPSVGRVVHFVAVAGGPCRAAIVTELLPGRPTDRVLTGREPETRVSLHVLEPNGSSIHRIIRHDAAGEANTWHWPADGRVCRV